MRPPLPHWHALSACLKADLCAVCNTDLDSRAGMSGVFRGGARVHTVTCREARRGQTIPEVRTHPLQAASALARGRTHASCSRGPAHLVPSSAPGTPCTASPAPRRLTIPRLRSVGNEKWVWTFDQFVDLPYVWVTASDTIPTAPSGGLLQVNMTRVIQDNSTVAGQTERVNSLGYYCETLLNILRVRPWAALCLGAFRGCARVRPVPTVPSSAAQKTSCVACLWRH